MSEADETLHSILHCVGEKVIVKSIEWMYLTSLLQLAQSSAECIMALIMAQAAGERLRSWIGRASRWFAEPRT